MEINFNKPKSRKLPHILAAVIIGIIVIIAGQIYYTHEAEIIREEKYDYLKTVAQLKVDQIVHWKSERLIDAQLLSKRIKWREVILRKY